jgi:hypothetical protein
VESSSIRSTDPSGMRQFSLQRLFVSVTLIAAGCGAIAWFVRWAATLKSLPNDAPVKSNMPALIVLGIVLIGVGIGNLFKRPVQGGVLSFVLLIVFCFVWVIFF